MLIRGVVGHKIEHHFEAARVSFSYKEIEISQCAEQRVDIDIVSHVIAEIGHRRGKNWRKPDCVDAQPLHIVEPAGDAAQISDAVGIAVLKGARVDLIDDSALPPEML